MRLAVPRDAPRLAELIAGGSLEAGAEPGDTEPYHAAVEEICATPGNDVIVAQDGATIVGMCQLIVFRHVQHNGGRCAEIESVHVAGHWRNRGVGGILLREAVRRARQAGCYRIQLTSNKARPAAHRFYLRHGFVASHEGFKLYLEP